MAMYGLPRTVQAMYDQIQDLRASQGFWLTSLELNVEQQPSEEALWSMVRMRAGVCVFVPVFVYWEGS